MGFVDENLLTGETVVYRAHVHWKVFVLPLFFFLAALVLFGSSLGSDGSSLGKGFAIVGCILLAPALIIGIERWIRFSASEFAVTNRRVLIKVGVIRRHSVELLLEKVEGIGIEQSMTGRLLNFGSIIVTGTGGTRETFHEISAPLEFRRQVQAGVGAGAEGSKD
jgi:uncharacterized membrane protein YdbT with pleckstrin-like domain